MFAYANSERKRNFSRLRLARVCSGLLGFHAWTVTRLAELAAMSRASFMRLYATLSPEPPLHFLSTIRMQLASRLLTQSSRKIVDIAAEVGYSSEAAFSKRFKEVFALPPGRYRLDAGLGTTRPQATAQSQPADNA
jgi:AraC-like DNA-binding protein